MVKLNLLRAPLHQSIQNAASESKSDLGNILVLSENNLNEIQKAFNDELSRVKQQLISDAHACDL